MLTSDLSIILGVPKGTTDPENRSRHPIKFQLNSTWAETTLNERTPAQTVHFQIVPNKVGLVGVTFTGKGHPGKTLVIALAESWLPL
jgi:hypothetical protein